MTKTQLVLALNCVGLEEVSISKSEIVQFSFECLICVDSASLCSVIGSEKPALTSQPIRCKTKTNHDLVIRVFPRFGPFAQFFFVKFSLVPEGIFVPYYQLLGLLWFWFYNAQPKSALKQNLSNPELSMVKISLGIEKKEKKKKEK